MKNESVGNRAQNTHNSPTDAQGADSVYCVQGLEGTEKLFSDLRSAGVELSVDREGRLAFDGPDHVLTDDRLATMRAHRDGLLALVERFEERAAVAQYDGGLSRSDAERLALAELLTKKHDGAPELAGVICPYCRSMAFEDVERGWQCCDCKRLAWIWLPGGSIVRADYENTNLAFEP